MSNPLLSLDIESECAVDNCTDSDCRHALDPHRNRITIMAIYTELPESQAHIFKNINELKLWLHDFLQKYPNFDLTGFNLKWDLKVLTWKDPSLRWLYTHWLDDVQIMVTAYTRKVTKEYMWGYQAKRKALNKERPAGGKHRDAKDHSLKVTAPYFLGVEPFWEAADHNDVEYVTKDAKYTYMLQRYLEEKLREEGSYDFYKNAFMKWNKFLAKVEAHGVAIDLPLIDQLAAQSEQRAKEIKAQLDKEWDAGYRAYFELKVVEIEAKYFEMARVAAAKNPSRDAVKVVLKYKDMSNKAVNKFMLDAEFNLGSPTQLKWLLKDYLGLDIVGFDDEETTGAAVLERLAGQGREDIKLFISWREQTKLSQAFFPSYKEMEVGGRLYSSFHPFRARTGRLSSSDVNLQNVPSNLHKIFTAGPGRKLITRDMSAIEPRLIAYYTEDKTLFSILKGGQDFHGYNTKLFCELECDVSEIKKAYPTERALSKEGGLAILYNAGANRLHECAQKYGVSWTLGECRYKVECLRKGYPEVEDFKLALNTLLLTAPMTNLFGRKYRIADSDDIYMKGFNTLIQGSASDMVLNSACKAQEEYDRLGLDAHVCLLVHDEIVVDAADECVTQAEQILERSMTEYDLTNSLGKINLLVEGKTANHWEK